MELCQLCVCDVLKGMLEPLVMVDALHLAGGEEGIHHSSALSALMGAGKQIVLAPQRQGANLVLDKVVVGQQPAVLEERHQVGPLVLCIGKCLADGAFGGYHAGLLVQPVFEAFVNWQGMLQAVSPPGLWPHSLAQALMGVDTLCGLQGMRCPPGVVALRLVELSAHSKLPFRVVVMVDSPT